MKTRPFVVAPADLIPLPAFLDHLTGEMDRRFDCAICDQAVGVVDDEIPDAALLKDKDLGLSLSDGGETISHRSLRLAFFGFCLMLSEDMPIESVEKMVPSIADIGSVTILVDRFIRIVGQRVNISVDEKGAWRTEPLFIIEATKLLPDFILLFRQVGEDEGRLAMMPDKGDDLEDDESMYQPAFLNENDYLVWTELWGRRAYDCRFLSALAHALAHVSQKMTLYATTMMMRLVTRRPHVKIEDFKLICGVVARECSESISLGRNAEAN